MNHIYKLKFDRSLLELIVVSELATQSVTGSRLVALSEDHQQLDVVTSSSLYDCSLSELIFSMATVAYSLAHTTAMNSNYQVNLANNNLFLTTESLDNFKSNFKALNCSNYNFTSRNLLALSLLVGSFGAATNVLAAPTVYGTHGQEGTVVAGTVSSVTDGLVTTITNSPNAIIDWKQFNINQNEILKFVQKTADSAVLNRVLGNQVSKILGTLQSNGQVFIVNPNGIVFGSKSHVDVGGLVASTLDINNNDFLHGHYVFNKDKDQAIAKVLNSGVIKIKDDGSLALIGGQVVNNGVLEAKHGTVFLLAGNSIEIADLHNPLVSYKVTAKNKAVNLGRVLGQNAVLLGNQVLNGKASKYTAGTFADVIGSEDTSANQASINADGQVVLFGGSQANTLQSTDQANSQVVGKRNGVVVNNGKINVSNAHGKAGKVQVLGDTVVLDANSKIYATGRTGGEVLIGGDAAGKGTLKLAHQTYLDQDQLVDLSAEDQAGHAVVWADQTHLDGNFKATSVNSDGGFIETSGHVIDFGNKNFNVDVDSEHGKVGTWLVDPDHIAVVNASNLESRKTADKTTITKQYDFQDGSDWVIGEETITTVTDNVKGKAGTTYIKDSTLSKQLTGKKVELEAKYGIDFDHAKVQMNRKTADQTTNASLLLKANTYDKAKNSSISFNNSTFTGDSVNILVEKDNKVPVYIYNSTFTNTNSDNQEGSLVVEALSTDKDLASNFVVSNSSFTGFNKGIFLNKDLHNVTVVDSTIDFGNHGDVKVIGEVANDVKLVNSTIKVRNLEFNTTAFGALSFDKVRLNTSERLFISRTNNDISINNSTFNVSNKFYSSDDPSLTLPYRIYGLFAKSSVYINNSSLALASDHTQNYNLIDIGAGKDITITNLNKEQGALLSGHRWATWGIDYEAGNNVTLTNVNYGPNDYINLTGKNVFVNNANITHGRAEFHGTDNVLINHLNYTGNSNFLVYTNYLNLSDSNLYTYNIGVALTNPVNASMDISNSVLETTGDSIGIGRDYHKDNKFNNVTITNSSLISASHVSMGLFGSHLEFKNVTIRDSYTYLQVYSANFTNVTAHMNDGDGNWNFFKVNNEEKSYLSTDTIHKHDINIVNSTFTNGAYYIGAYYNIDEDHPTGGNVRIENSKINTINGLGLNILNNVSVINSTINLGNGFDTRHAGKTVFNSDNIVAGNGIGINKDYYLNQDLTDKDLTIENSTLNARLGEFTINSNNKSIDIANSTILGGHVDIYTWNDYHDTHINVKNSNITAAYDLDLKSSAPGNHYDRNNTQLNVDNSKLVSKAHGDFRSTTINISHSNVTFANGLIFGAYSGAQDIKIDHSNLNVTNTLQLETLNSINLEQSNITTQAFVVKPYQSDSSHGVIALNNSTFHINNFDVESKHDVSLNNLSLNAFPNSKDISSINLVSGYGNIDIHDNNLTAGTIRVESRRGTFNLDNKVLNATSDSLSIYSQNLTINNSKLLAKNDLSLSTERVDATNVTFNSKNKGIKLDGSSYSYFHNVTFTASQDLSLNSNDLKTFNTTISSTKSNVTLSGNSSKLYNSSISAQKNIEINTNWFDGYDTKVNAKTGYIKVYTAYDSTLVNTTFITPKDVNIRFRELKGTDVTINSTQNNVLIQCGYFCHLTNSSVDAKNNFEYSGNWLDAKNTKFNAKTGHIQLYTAFDSTLNNSTLTALNKVSTDTRVLILNNASTINSAQDNVTIQSRSITNLTNSSILAQKNIEFTKGDWFSATNSKVEAKTGYIKEEVNYDSVFNNSSLTAVKDVSINSSRNVVLNSTTAITSTQGNVTVHMGGSTAQLDNASISAQKNIEFTGNWLGLKNSKVEAKTGYIKEKIQYDSTFDNSSLTAAKDVSFNLNKLTLNNATAITSTQGNATVHTSDALVLDNSTISAQENVDLSGNWLWLTNSKVDAKAGYTKANYQNDSTFNNSSLTAAKDVNVDFRTLKLNNRSAITSTSGNVSVNVASASLFTVNLKAAKDLTVDSKHNLELDATTAIADTTSLIAVDKVSLIDNSKASANNGDLNIKAQSISLDNSTVNATQALNLTAQTGIDLLANSNLLATGDINVKTYTGIVNLKGQADKQVVINSTNGNVVVSTDTAHIVDHDANTGSDLNIEHTDIHGNNVTVVGSGILTSHASNFTATKIDLGVTNLTADTIHLDQNSNVVAKNGVIINATTPSTGALTLDDVTVNTEKGLVNLTAVASVELSHAHITTSATDDASDVLVKAKSISLSDSDVNANDITVENTDQATNDLDLTNVKLTSHNNVKVNSNANLNLDNATLVGKAVTLEVTAGKTSLTHNSSVTTTAENLEVNANDISVDHSKLKSAKALSLISNTDVEVLGNSSLVADKDVTVNANVGSITFNGDDSDNVVVNSTAGNVKLSSTDDLTIDHANLAGNKLETIVGNDLHVINASLVARQDGETTTLTAHSVDLTNTKVQATAGLEVNSNTNLDLNNSTLVGKAVTLGATDKVAVTNNSTVSATAGNLKVTADTIEVDNSKVNATQVLSLSAKVGIDVLGNSNVTSTDDLSLTSTTGEINLKGQAGKELVINAIAGNLVVSTDATNVLSHTNPTGADVTVEHANLNGNNVTVVGSGSLKAHASSLTASKAGVGVANLTADTILLDQDSQVLAQNGITVAATTPSTGSLTTDHAVISTVKGPVDLRAVAKVDLVHTQVTTDAKDANSKVNVKAVSTRLTDTNLKAHDIDLVNNGQANGDVTLTNSKLTATKNLTVDSKANLTTNNASLVAQVVKANAVGKATFTNNSTVSATNSGLDITANTIEVNNSKVNATQALSLDAKAGISVLNNSNVTATDDVTLTTDTGAINIHGQANKPVVINSTVGNVKVVADTDVTVYDATLDGNQVDVVGKGHLRTEAASFTARELTNGVANLTAGSINLGTNTNVNAQNGVILNATTGNLATQDAKVNTKVGNVTVNALTNADLVNTTLVTKAADQVNNNVEVTAGLSHLTNTTVVGYNVTVATTDPLTGTVTLDHANLNATNSLVVSAKSDLTANNSTLVANGTAGVVLTANGNATLTDNTINSSAGGLSVTADKGFTLTNNNINVEKAINVVGKDDSLVKGNTFNTNEGLTISTASGNGKLAIGTNTYTEDKPIKLNCDTPNPVEWINGKHGKAYQAYIVCHPELAYNGGNSGNNGNNGGVSVVTQDITDDLQQNTGISSLTNFLAHLNIDNANGLGIVSRAGATDNLDLARTCRADFITLVNKYKIAIADIRSNDTAALVSKYKVTASQAEFLFDCFSRNVSYFNSLYNK